MRHLRLSLYDQSMALFHLFFFSKQQIWIFKCGGWKMTSNYANKGSCMSGHVPLDKLQPWASFTCKRRMTRGTSESKCADWWMLPGLFWMRLSAQKGTSLDLFIALDLNVIRAVISLVTWLPLFFNEIPLKLRRKWRQFQVQVYSLKNFHKTAASVQRRATLIKMRISALSAGHLIKNSLF